MGLKLFSRDPFVFTFAGEIEDCGFADQGFQGNPVQGYPAFDDMGGSVQVGSQVVAEANRLNRIPVLLQTRNLSELWPLISRPDRHTLLNRKGQVNVPDHPLALGGKGFAVTLVLKGERPCRPSSASSLLFFP